MHLSNPFKYTLILLLLLFVSACNNDNDNTEYRIVLDAGSTSTRLYFYQYSDSNGLPMNIETLLNIKEEPGIEDVSTDELDDYLNNIFTEDVILQIQQIAIIENNDNILSQIQFYSTAGMRTLSTTEQDEINSNVKEWIINWSVDNLITIDSSNIDVRTLSGEEEATYDWVSVNYLNNYFQGQLYGVADFGGTSTEIAYLNTQLANVYVTANNTQYSLSSYSYILGSNSIATLMEDTDSCFLTNYTSTAAGDYSLCKTATTSMLEEHEDISTPNASNIAQYFLISGFDSIAYYYGITDNFSLSALETAAGSFCLLDWDTAQAQYPDANQEFLPLLCLSSAFQVTLMNNFYLLTDNTQSFSPVYDINNERANWSIGVLVTQDYQEIN